MTSVKTYLYDPKTGERTEIKSCISDIDELFPPIEDDGVISLPQPKTSGEFTCNIDIRFPSYKEFKKIYGMPKLNKHMFPTYNNGFPVITVNMYGHIFRSRGRNSIWFIRRWNKMARKYNSGLHDVFVKVNMQEKVIKKC